MLLFLLESYDWGNSNKYLWRNVENYVFGLHIVFGPDPYCISDGV